MNLPDFTDTIAAIATKTIVSPLHHHFSVPQHLLKIIIRQHKINPGRYL
jgi:hypothetical protein